MKNLSWFAFFLLLTASCLDDPDCFQLHNDIVGVTFRVIGTGQGDSVLLKNFSNSGADTVITSFNFRLNYFVEEGLLTFEGIQKSHALAFGYTVKNQFISEECGSSFVLSDLRILSHDFDSARVINSSPTKAPGTNIEIYRCPETDTLTINFNQLFATTNGVTITNPRSSFVSHPFDTITFQYDNEVFSGSAATVNLPVDLAGNEATYVFKTDLAVDTLIVRYNTVTSQRYRPCGIQTFVNNLTIHKHTFDSISFGLNADDEPARALLDPHIANLRVFDCPPTNLLRVGFKNSDNAAQSVTIKSITADHIPENLLTEPASISTVDLPVDLASGVSTFYFQYEDDIIDTVSVQYSRSSLTLFDACKDPVITSLAEVTDLPNITIVPGATTLQYPPQSANVEITVE